MKKWQFVEALRFCLKMGFDEESINDSANIFSRNYEEYVKLSDFLIKLNVKKAYRQ